MDTLNKIWKENGIYVLMALTYLLQIGFDRARNLLDDEIAEVKANTDENSIITPELNEWLMQTAREIASNMSEVQVIQWCQVNKPYDTKGIKKA